VVVTLLALLAGTAAADISARARLEPPRLQVGEPGELAVEVEGAQDVAPPRIADVEGLTVRYVGPTTQVSIVNGRVTASVTHRFSVVASRPGTFTLGPISVEHGGRQYAAGTLSVQVLPAGGGRGGAPRGVDQVRLDVSVAKPEVYLHERVDVTVTLSVGSVRVSGLQYPTLVGDGFALEKFPEPVQRREQTAQGVVDVVEFRTILTPLRTGTLTLGPARMAMQLHVRGRTNDPFFGSLFGETRRPIEPEAEPVTLTVLPLPEENRPTDFTGAVGRFDFDVRAAPLDLAAGDPVTVTMTIRAASHEANLEAVAAPSVPASDVLRTYPMQPATPAPGGQAPATPLAKTFEQVVIPRRPGSVALPPLRFSYFDPAARAYRTITRGPIALSVRPSAHAEAAPRIEGAVAQPARPEALGRDIVSIKDAPGALRPIGARRWRSAAFWAAQAVPLLAWITAVLHDRRRRRLTGDVRYARFARAGRAARRAIGAARTALGAGDRVAFYDTLARAVSEYLAAKLDLPPGSVSPETVAERLQSRGASREMVQHVAEFFAACEHARFAPAGDAAGDMPHTLARATTIVRRLERERRLGPPAAAVWLVVGIVPFAGAAALAAESPNTIFFRGNALYGEGRFTEAAAEYERVLAAGLESGSLYFNLGNAHFRAGDVGRAILNYERARRLLPRDPDVQANLGFAQSLSGDADGEPLLARLVFPLAGRLATDELLFAASLAWTALMLLLVAGRLAPTRRRAAARAAAGAAVVLAAVVGSAGYRLVRVDLPSWAVVVARDDANVRFEPSPTGTAHFQAKPGSVLRLLGEREGWAQVARRDGRRGWVERGALAAL
jgi:tetratricopeptide (TPR) repeat protein